jgi:DNA-binding transcriptional ArsR family regulator
VFQIKVCADKKGVTAMGTFWLKVAGIALCGFVVVAVIGAVSSGNASESVTDRGATPGDTVGVAMAKPTVGASGPVSARNAALTQSTPNIPEFEFDVGGRPPSRSVYGLAAERVVQKILFVTNESELTAGEVANHIGEAESGVPQTLSELRKYGLVEQQGQGWRSKTRLYTRAEIQEGETLSLKYAKQEAEILRQAIPRLREVYAKTTLSRTLPWDDLSLIVVGALLSDFCTVDRIPFRPQNVSEETVYYLQTPEGKPWGFEGYEKLPKRFPSCRWTFYQNQFRKYNGGIARFGYYGNPNEQRKEPVINPGGWCMGPEGRILFALAEGPLSLGELESATEMRRELLQGVLDKMAGYDPPAVVNESGKYRTKVPIFTALDLSLMLSECDRVAQDIYDKVVRSHAQERQARARELGRKWPLPAGTYVRDRALQMLVEEGLLSAVPAPPVHWKFGVWGWTGFMPMNEELTEGVLPDPFLLTAVTNDEGKLLQETESLRAGILKGSRFKDVSTPAKAFLTRFSAFVHTDVGTLREVQVPSEQIGEDYFTDPKRRGWSQEMAKLSVRRLPPVPASPKEGDVSVVFAFYERSFEDAHVYFYHNGGWRFLFNTSDVGFWSKNAQKTAQERLASLR